MFATSDPRINHLLDALPSADWQRWSNHLEWVELPRGAVLKASGCTMSHVYFPTTAVLTLMYLSENGDSTAVAIVGNEGLVGLESLMAGATAHRVVVQCAGGGFRLKAQAMQDELARGGCARRILLCSLQALITQIQQTAACVRQHSVDQRLCRLLLMCLDRIQGKTLPMAQEQIAAMLGVRRESVSAHAQPLRLAGLVDWSRNRITVLDHRGLEHRACECYAAVRKERDRLSAAGAAAPRPPINHGSLIARAALEAAL